MIKRMFFRLLMIVVFFVAPFWPLIIAIYDVFSDLYRDIKSGHIKTEGKELYVGIWKAFKKGEKI